MAKQSREDAAAGRDPSKIVAQAEAAVAGIKDAELRRVAFEKILDALLSDGAHGPAPCGPSTAG